MSRVYKSKPDDLGIYYKIKLAKESGKYVFIQIRKKLLCGLLSYRIFPSYGGYNTSYRIMENKGKLKPDAFIGSIRQDCENIIEEYKSKLFKNESEKRELEEALKRESN